jgi:hypothetical protein
MPSLEIISSNTLTGTQQYVTLSTIPNTYKHLKLILTARSDGIPDWFLMSFNGDNTGSNYFSRLIYADRNSGSTSTGTQTPSEQPLTGVVNKNTALANSFSNAEIVIYNYASSINPKVFSGTSGQNNNTDPERQAFWENRWNNSAAITSIRLGCQTASSNNFVAGTTITLYGMP